MHVDRSGEKETAVRTDSIGPVVRTFFPFFLSIPEWWSIFLLFVFFNVFRPRVGVCVSQLSLARRLRRYCPLLRILYETVSAQARAFELGL